MFEHIDCFSGTGGICTGFRSIGVRTVLAIEKIATCVQTYHANHPQTPIILRDIREVDNSEIPNADVITAGIPCETFSTAGRHSRAQYDSRQTLFHEGIRIAKVANAKIILFENVPNFLTKTVSQNSRRLVVEDLRDSLAAAGFQILSERVLDAASFGIPQHRERLFILACHTRVKARHRSTPRQHLKTTVGMAFSDLPIAGQFARKSSRYRYTDIMRDQDFWKLDCQDNTLTQHTPSGHRQKTIRRFSLLRHGEGLAKLFKRLDHETIFQLQQEGVLPKTAFRQRNQRLNPLAVSPTVTSHCLDELVHPDEDRALTVREVARLQSFPDMYRFCGPISTAHDNRDVQDMYEQIGDAVPPLLARELGLEIASLLYQRPDFS